MAITRNILGICGAPCVGKTTLANKLAKHYAGYGGQVELLPELARILAEQGVKIDKEMGEADYDAFLAGYNTRDSETPARLAIADRTPVDHFSYIDVNHNLPTALVERHRRGVLDSTQRYRLLLYLPIQFAMRDDKFRETDTAYQKQLDDSIWRMLEATNIRVEVLRGDKKKRFKQARALIGELWPELGLGSAAGG